MRYNQKYEATDGHNDIMHEETYNIGFTRKNIST